MKPWLLNVVAVLIAAASCPAQDSLNVRLVTSINVWDYSGQASVVGSYAYVPAGNAGLRIIDVSDPLAPYQIGVFDSPGYAYAVSIRGNYAYLADYGSGLRVIDVSSPAAPTEAGSHDTPGYAFDICVQGDYCYVADYTSGLRVIDIASPSSPIEIGFFDTPGHVLDVSVQGDYAYVTDDPYDLRIIDVSNPSSPQQASFFDPPGTSHDIAVQGSLVYLVGYSASSGIGFRVIDATSPVAPLQISYLLDRADGIAVDGGFAYLVTNGGIGWPFRVIDVCNSGTPLEVGHHWLASSSVTVAGGLIYAGGFWHFGIYENLAIHATPKSGNQSGSWPASCSPYLVTGDITVPAGQTLTIEPGVEVRFSGDYKFNVQGTLVAVGTAQDSIKFTCDTLANPNKWAGIRFLNTGNNNSILQYCVIENGRADGATADDRVGGGVYAIYTDITLRNCTIRNCSAQVHGGALWAAHHLIRIEDCIFENNSCQSAGGAVRLDQGAYSILRTSFLNNHATNDIGGGLYVESASGSPQEVRNCTFTGNTSLHDGGAMYLYNTNVVVDSCDITANHAGGSGGGLYAYNVGGSVSHSTFDHDSANGEAGAVAFLFSTASFTDCNFLHNRAASIGAFWCSASTPALTRCTFDHNQATGTVGAFYCNAPTNAELSECIFTNNSAGSDGGACYLDGGTPSFDYCTFSQNSSGGDGGAIMSEGCDAVITRGLFAENNTAGEGAAVYMVNSGGSINHSTLASNTGSVALWVQSSQPAISNCVVRSDFNGGTFEIEYSPNASIHHCCFSGGSQGVVCPCPPDFWTGWTTNSNGDDCDASFNLFAYNPLFVDEVGGNYNLACGSPCIDAGDPLSAPDPDGTVVDMGYLYHPHSSIIPAAPEQLVIRRDTPTTDLKLYWSPVTHDVNNVPIVVCGYEIERALTADFVSFTILGSSTDTTYTDAVSVPSQMNAFYRVKAVME